MACHEFLTLNCLMTSYLGGYMAANIAYIRLSCSETCSAALFRHVFVAGLTISGTKTTLVKHSASLLGKYLC